MFAKKLLSAVALLLFLGNQSVHAFGTISSCTSETKTGCNNNSGTSITYLCIDGLKIYGFASGATGTCLQEFSLTDDALSVIGVVDNNSDPSNPTSTITKQSDTITSAEGKLTIFSCTSGECTQQFGYVFDASNQYSVGSEGDSAKLTFDSTTVCNTAGVGVIIKKSGTTDTIEFCLDGTNEKSVTVSSDNEGDYLMVGTKLGEGSTLPASRLTTTEGQDNTVITIGSNYIIYNEAYTTNSEIYCANDQNKLETRFENICSSTDCDYYTCASGRCTESSSNCPATVTPDDNCNPVSNPSKCMDGGFYIVDGSNALITTQNSSGATITLYKCVESSGVECSNDGFTIPTGYIPNADDVSASEYKYSFIKCDGSNCEGYNAPDKTACEAAGQLINLNSSTLSICLQMTKADNSNAIVSAPLSAAGSYFVDTKVSNIFGDRSSDSSGYTFVIVDVTATSVQLHGKDDEDSRYKYTDNTYKIYNRSSNKSNICDASKTINEFELNQCSDYQSAENYYYKLKQSHEWPNV